MSNIIPRFGAAQSLLCIVLETKQLVFASLTSDRRQIVVRECQHPASAVQCKQPQVTMQTLVPDHTAAGGIAVCLSDSLVQSALALVGQTLGVRASEGQVQNHTGHKKKCMQDVA